jgi:hypothetical protein
MIRVALLSSGLIALMVILGACSRLRSCFSNNVVRPPGTGSSQVRLVSSFLFPKSPAK